MFRCPSLQHFLSSCLPSKGINIKICRTIILPVVLCGCRTRYLTFMQKVFENRVLREIFGAKRKEVTGEWRKFHNEELRHFYSSNINRVMNSWTMR